MKIRIKTMAITPLGTFDAGVILTTDKYSSELLNHLVTDCNAADVIDYETKIDADYEPVKKPPSTLSLEPANHSQKKTRGRPRKIRQ